jgi:DNA polymerase (family 10)
VDKKSMKNQEIANIFYQIAIYLEMDNIPFKPQAYEKAAFALESLSEDVKDIFQREGEEGLKKIPGVGENIAKKIIEYLNTGKIKEYEKYHRQMPVKIGELIQVEGIGPKMIKALYQNLKITNLKDLEKAAAAGKLRNLPNFGEKTEKNILDSLAFLKRSRGRFLLSEALFLAEDIILQLKKVKEIDKIVYAGSLRRMKETIGDIDLLATVQPSFAKASEGRRKVMDAFVNLDGIIKVWDYGLTKSSVRFDRKIDVDLRVVDDDEFGSALQYFTGSKDHNIKTRKLAMEKNLKLNEYGVFKGKKLIAGKTEEEVYKVIGLSYIEPELREDRGEIEAALKDELPNIIGYDEIKGDLHCHSDWDGGENSLEEMAEAAKFLGYEYLGISDHTKFLRIENGLDEKQLLEQHKAIEKLNKKLQVSSYKFQVLHGCETNILNDGSLDIDDKVLAQLDYVIAGVHSNMKMTREEMTQRMIKAMQNPYVKIISHPTGRLINRRDEYQLDIEKIIEVARETGTALEINSFPSRLDLNDKNIRKAIEKGVKLVINTDAHHRDHLQFMRFGIGQARRGWATKDDIINSWPLEKLLEFFHKV